MSLNFESEFDSEVGRWTDEWMKFLSFPSIGAQPESDPDCRACADWLRNHLDAIGMQARLIETTTKPLVFAEYRGKPGHPVILFYGHYDVQPVDPLNEWTSPPFAPVLLGNRVYARGAQDDKGQVFSFIKGLETLIRRQELNATVRILLEGEEECGSNGLIGALPSLTDLLYCDILMVADTDMSASGAPAVVMGLRGIAHLTVTLTGPDHDLHSGLHGGLAPNPMSGIARLIASLHNPDGAVAVQGFYDAVRPPTRAESDLAMANKFDTIDYRRLTGVQPLAGESNFPPQLRLGFRPAIDINGMHGGYGGVGSKTIIPSKAMAKISMRLVPDQNPETCLDLLAQHLALHLPPGFSMKLTERHASGPGFRLNPDTPTVQKARAVLASITGKQPAFLWQGASIPIVSTLATYSRNDPLLVGFGREEDRIHAPNESYSLEQFRLGYLYTAHLLASH